MDFGDTSIDLGLRERGGDDAVLGAVKNHGWGRGNGVKSHCCRVAHEGSVLKHEAGMRRASKICGDP